MNFDVFLNKKVRVRQKDNFIKEGILVGHDNNFIFLLFNTGEKVAIAKDAVLEIKEIKGEGHHGKNRY
jgi:small nuclear ribonucleoprotein (snRNP)-like protein